MKLALILSMMLVLATSAHSEQPPESPPENADVAQLLSMHEDVLRAHRENDVDGMLANESDEQVVVNRGDVMHPTREQRRQIFTPYFESTVFTEYRDLIPPIVTISQDGTLGWLIAQVKIAGTRTADSGVEVPFGDTWAWIELYEKRDGAWLRVGNVSNRKPEPGE